LIKFGKISEQEFLADYWQKKPLLIKQAFPGFISPISPEELAGLSLEEEFESRLVSGSIADNKWSLESDPFDEDTFNTLPDKNWTLLVQGVDRFIPEIEELITHFDFIPRWRFDDVMISYAATGGSVGPHFDYYDVFLLQGSGRRRWELSTQFCNLDNYLENVPLRIMDKFIAEQSFEVEPGDLLYIPPKVAHHGVSLDDNCTSLSFGYRSYTAQEMFDNKLYNNKEDLYYQDPIWENTNNPAFIPNSAIDKANKIGLIAPEDFAKFVTKLDTLDEKILQDFEFEYQDSEFDSSAIYELFPMCKAGYIKNNEIYKFFINGKQIKQIKQTKAMINFCNSRQINTTKNTDLSKQLFDLNLIYTKT